MLKVEHLLELKVKILKPHNLKEVKGVTHSAKECVV
jgi:hypothetical protein